MPFVRIGRLYIVPRTRRRTHVNVYFAGGGIYTCTRFEQRLAELGWVPSRTISIDYWWTGRHFRV